MKNKKLLCLICFALLFALTIVLVCCTDSTDNENGESTDTIETTGADENTQNYVAYNGNYSKMDGTYGGVDDLGRVLADDTVGKVRDNRYVGIFYFLWQGEHGTGGPYDNTKIVANNPDAIKSEEAWLASGGGGIGEHHFWGEPLFGYYTSSDTWVMRKHCQMLTDAGVDFICFDTTNGFTYIKRVKQLISVWYEYLEAGYNVPKLVFYTNSGSGQTMNYIYKEIYANQKLIDQYPLLSELWFNWDGKPLIIGNKEDPVLNTEVKDFFRIKANQWPTEGRKSDGFPWMEFSRLLKLSSIYGLDGRKEVMNVSIAQHNQTIQMSVSAWYGGKDRSRNFNGRSFETAEDAHLYGYNFASQWKYAIKHDPEMVFVTGWNEWVAQRQPAAVESEPIRFIDCADYVTSRDAEPMRGYFGDNYYLQLIDNIRKYKGTPERVYVGDNIKIDIGGGFDQWESDNITAVYSDYKNDTVDRNAIGFGNINYVNTSGRNDITFAKVAKDKDNFYFYVETAEDITSYTDTNWMTLFLKTGGENNWYGYDFAVNVTSPESKDKAVLSRSTGGYKWEKVCTVDMKISGNKLMLSIPRDAINMSAELFSLEFKWADNYIADDIWSFYTEGDAAPYGRLNYVYSNAVLAETEEPEEKE